MRASALGEGHATSSDRVARAHARAKAISACPPRRGACFKRVFFLARIVPASAHSRVAGRFVRVKAERFYHTGGRNGCQRGKSKSRRTRRIRLTLEHGFISGQSSVVRPGAGPNQPPAPRPIARLDSDLAVVLPRRNDVVAQVVRASNSFFTGSRKLSAGGHIAGSSPRPGAQATHRRCAAPLRDTAGMHLWSSRPPFHVLHALPSARLCDGGHTFL
jgi:hypothetical protein